MDYYVYILYSISKDRYYTGFTHEINTILFKHNSGATPSTRSGIPWKVVYCETCSNKHDAILRESEIKGKKSRNNIEKLIQNKPFG
jgi:putative endonuclease